MVRLLSWPRSVCSVHRTLKPLRSSCLFCSQHFHRFSVQRSCDDACEYEAFDSGHCSGTMFDVSKAIQERIGLEPGYNLIPKCRANLLKYQPERKDLPTRSMKDSFTTAKLELSSAMLRNNYVNHLGCVRMGRLIEDIDMFAVWICYRHVSIPKLPQGIPIPYVFVTLLVDMVDFMFVKNISSEDDIFLSGHVSWIGTSSMEITIYLRQNMRTIIKTIMMMVARNATNTGLCPVNPLQPADKKEERCYEESIKRQKLRMVRQAKSVLNVRPTKNDEKLMYEIFKRTRGDDALLSANSSKLPPSCCWMCDSYQTTMFNCFPDNRNSLNQIFGGFVMRQAVEISFVTASIYCGSGPMIKCILDVAFYTPIKVNSFLKIRAHVVYTYKRYIQIITIVQVLDGDTMEQITGNALHITYQAKKNVKEVLPFTYQETLWYINGRNKFQAYRKLKSKRMQNRHS